MVFYIPNIHTLDPSGNRLTSTINCSKPLTHLDLTGNLLVGGIPATLANCSSLKTLSLSSNQLSGNVPPELGRLPNLCILEFNDTVYHDFGRNNFTGYLPSLPIDTGRFGNGILYAVLADRNHLIGSLNEVLFEKCKNLNGLIVNFSNNMLSSGIPDEIGSLCSSLLVLDVTGNQITGDITQSLRELKGLSSLLVAGNNLSGGIPDALVHLHVVQRLKELQPPVL